MSREYEKLKAACHNLAAMMEVVAESANVYMSQVDAKEWKFKAEVEREEDWNKKPKLTIRFAVSGGYDSAVTAATPMEAVLEFLRRKGWREENEPKPMPLLITQMGGEDE